ncbi:MAG: asparagine synthase (glutamine-hydrolyzing) [Rhodospirillales bacterium]|nr:asparagine synthase (glutamine-hydrolyzing) [Rhodospirillales bacterium]
MCGIAGLFLPERAAVIEPDIDAMLAVMIHRGPDGDGRYVSPNGCYQAGFRRLAIIDLETGHQPIEDTEGGRVVMGNGEIYNYREIKERHPDYPYRTQGDMEPVLPLARAKGDAFVHELNGMYALALYDLTQNRLLLVRDQLGVKPLYWARVKGGGVLFASEIKSLFASGLVPAAVDEDAVAAYVAHGWVPAPRTLFTGVHKLPPGHLLSAGADGTVVIERYWRPMPAHDLPDAPAEIEEHLAALLSDSVRLQLRSDVPVGALLSGGLDSGLMVALAARQSPQPINTFTVSFEGTAIDEAPLACMVAERYATRHTAITVAADSAVAYLPKLAWHAEEPNFDAALLPNYLIDRVLAKHVTVALNGTGGDELFAGYGRYFQVPAETAYLALPGWLRRRVIEPVAEAAAPMLAWRLRRAAFYDGNRGAYLNAHTGHFPPPLRDLIGYAGQVPAVSVQATLYDEFIAGLGDDRQTAALYADIGSYLPDDLLALLDRTTMAVSVEGRVPYLDHRVVEAALAVPSGLRTPGGRGKGLQRRIAAGFLPEPLLMAPKQGFASPVPAWIKAGLGSIAGRILKRRRATERGWWTAAGIDRLLADPDRHGFRIYSLLMLELAVGLFVDGNVAAAPEGDLEAFADAT